MTRATLVLLLMACTAARAQSPETVQLPVQVKGSSVVMHLQYFKPQGPGPFPVVIHLHGRGVNRDERAAMRQAVPSSHAQWWLSRGVAVVAPVRVGYGETGGPDLEDTGARWEGSRCTGQPDFSRVAWAARDAAAIAHDWVQNQSWASRDRILVEGYSFGGLAALAVAGLDLAGLRGVINFSGGTAGNPIDSPGRSCRPDLMASTMEVLGAQSRVPSLWLYADNDPFWGPDAPREWNAAFRRARGVTLFARLAPLPGMNGHDLMAEAPQLWSRYVIAFVRHTGFLPDAK